MTILLKIIRLWNLESFVKPHTTKIVKDPLVFAQITIFLLCTHTMTGSHRMSTKQKDGQFE